MPYTAKQPNSYLNNPSTLAMHCHQGNPQSSVYLNPHIQKAAMNLRSKFQQVATQALVGQTLDTSICLNSTSVVGQAGIHGCPAHDAQVRCRE